MKEFALGFFSVLALGAVLLAALWKWLDREERRFVAGHL